MTIEATSEMLAVMLKFVFVIVFFFVESYVFAVYEFASLCNPRFICTEGSDC